MIKLVETVSASQELGMTVSTSSELEETVSKSTELLPIPNWQSTDAESLAVAN